MLHSLFLNLQSSDILYIFVVWSFSIVSPCWRQLCLPPTLLSVFSLSAPKQAPHCLFLHCALVNYFSVCNEPFTDMSNIQWINIKLLRCTEPWSLWHAYILWSFPRCLVSPWPHHCGFGHMVFLSLHTLSYFSMSFQLVSLYPRFV